MSKRLVLGLTLLALIVAFFALDLQRFFTLESLQAHRASLLEFVAQRWLLAAGAYVLLYIAVVALALPAAGLMTVAGGALFGLLGVPLVLLAATLGATISMLLSRYLFRESVERRFAGALKTINDGLKREGAFYLFAMRLVPAIPFFLINVAMGVTQLRVWTFAWVSAIGMLPGTLVWIYLGQQVMQLTSLKGLVSPTLLLALALLGVMPLLAKRLVEFLRARRVYRGHSKPRRYDYNLIAIGAGSAGLVSSYIAAAVKAKVALIERHKMGGDCLNTGCVPSKALIRTARLAAECRRADRYGLAPIDPAIDFARAMQRVHEVIAKIEPHDSIDRYTGLGVTCISGDARIVDPWTVEVNGQRLTSRAIVIATGARPTVPKLPGIDSVDFLTSDTVWSLRERPQRLLVLGGGPIGCELGQCFQRLGCQVTLVQRPARLLPREDEDASALVDAALRSDGVDVRVGTEALRVERDGAGGRLWVRDRSGEHAIAFDRLLLALGRTANVNGFGLEELGVRIAERGTIENDAWMRTNFPNLYVCGDVAGPYQFTHVAAHQAWYAAVNALFAPFWTFKADYRVIPWCTFTDPEVARVGLSESEAKAQNVAYELAHYGLDDLDRAIADGHDHGYVKVLTVPGKDTILGATIVGAHAGDLLAEFVLAMRHGLGLRKILGTIHSYPTMMEANKYTAGVWARAHAPAGALKWIERFHAWRRG